MNGISNLEENQHGKLFRAKQWIYRFFKYLIRRPKPFVDPELNGKVVVVLGSAPTATIPAGMNSTYRLITINGSQQALDRWGNLSPNVTIMMFNQIEGTNANAREVRRVLNGRRTGKLLLMLWRHDKTRLETGLSAFNYGYKELVIIDRYSRVALVKAVAGVLNFELDASSKFSNGIIAVLHALHSGAATVVISGINPLSTGHAYNAVSLHRKHSGPDMCMIKRLVRLGFPIYTSDKDVAVSTGLPLWQG